eukprot:CAMPEP_0201505648 /NCGR_PEP_ID=MMETSP0151_2-20130828/85891_1 /ASSEMBLY_ACC=CAM_ASM_000257 /TAXON_ID=200890 /ORGANISM="Paramoeba atlantica, Strain 621/1 / CCAP 1560/9" /LENGTH=89 /DNA_ID=CAMNT_0047899549 /DNA_START=190 /DNA_END=459 /DNA_ORIENTATION=-
MREKVTLSIIALLDDPWQKKNKYSSKKKREKSNLEEREREQLSFLRDRLHLLSHEEGFLEKKSDELQQGEEHVDRIEIVREPMPLCFVP